MVMQGCAHSSSQRARGAVISVWGLTDEKLDPDGKPVDTSAVVLLRAWAAVTVGASPAAVVTSTGLEAGSCTPPAVTAVEDML